jgi:GDP-4-dehydro-6-deoxy-D-mannose reductase
VYHLAGQSDVARSWHDVTTTYRTNVEGLLNVLAASRASGVAKVVAVISADVYGHVRPEQLPLDEDTPMRPVSPYGVSKVAADFVAMQAHLGYGMDVVRARPFTHIGPGQSPGFVASALASRIAIAERDALDEVTVGTLDTRRDFTDVRDVVRAYRLLALHGRAGDVYNVCTGADISIQELADTLVSLAQRPVRLVPDPALLRPADVPVLRGDASRLHALTGWKPEIPLATTLQDVLDDWRVRVRT